MTERATSFGVSFWGEIDDTGALRRYQTLVDAVDDGIYQLNAEGHFVGVSDEGTSIDSEDADRIFEVFQRLHTGDHSGTGIGLALCDRIVERHGGDIRVDSEPGEGATFSFTLPAVRDG